MIFTVASGTDAPVGVDDGAADVLRLRHHGLRQQANRDSEKKRKRDASPTAYHIHITSYGMEVPVTVWR